MAPYRRLRDEEALGDEPGGEPFAQAVEHVPFAPREIVFGSADGACVPEPRTCAELPDQPSGELPRECGLAAQDADERRAEPGRVHSLEQIPRRARLQRGEEILVIASGG